MRLPLCIAGSLMFTALLLGIAPANSYAKPPHKRTHTGLSYQLPTALDNQPNQQTADAFGWQIFTALNWPAQPGARGVPDKTKVIGEPGTVVWETWKAPNEVFYPDGSKPPSWETYGTPIPEQCEKSGSSTGNASPTVLSDTLVNRTSQAAGGSLTDQHGQIVHYQITFNRPVFDLIYENGYYNIAGQNAMSGPVNFAAGAGEMKAAWRILQPNEPEAVKRRFFRRKMYVYTPAMGQTPATCKYQEVALIGLHFNWKVTYPDNSTQWIMATFEQVDNVPPFKSSFEPGKNPGHLLPYSLFSKRCYKPGANCEYNQSTEQGRPVGTPTEAIRTVAIEADAKKLNPVWQKRFRQAVAGNPWQYYQMITTQYPSDPSQKPIGAPSPAYSANTTMETYVRQSSCLNCHYTARDINAKYSTDYSFMLAQACPQPLFPPSGGAQTSAVCTRQSSSQKP
ncbi:MAG: hypothetical protein AB1400_02290 [Pseudomonadota bacterium]